MAYTYKRIRELREEKNITQTDISKFLECSQRVYSDYERGKLDVPTRILVGLAKYHGVSIDYLLNQTSNKERNI